MQKWVNVLWDFDGVILDSMKIRDEGFYEIFKSHPLDIVEKLMDFHHQNGGLSRYVKIRYFYNELLGQKISDEKVSELASQFSEVMMQKLVDPSLLILDSVNFIKSNHHQFHFHIVSGSDGKELNLLCEKLGLSSYFITINGSPTPKIQLVSQVMKNHQYKNTETVLIGDSINDYEAAKENNIRFMGYNNPKLKIFGDYINSFKDISLVDE